MSTERKFSKGEVIFKQGDEGNSFFKIIEGSVEVLANYGEERERELTVLEAGAIFGEMAVIETYPRSTTIVAKEDTLALEIGGKELNGYFAENPEMIYEIMKHLGSRIKELTAEYDVLTSVLKEVKASQDKKSDSIFAKIKKYIDYYASGKNNINKPSAEALREASEGLKEQQGKIETYDKGTVIFKEGEIGKCMYIVYGGMVGIFKNYGDPKQVKLTDLYPVSFFGEMGMIADEARSATAVAEMDETFVEIIRPEGLENLFRESPVKVEMILKHLSYRLRMLTYDYLTACKEINDLYNS
ncbi:MAG: cyclic nucleotide-binding domain-containing protein [Lachnospiraceae bacterium]|nr:cyclic nucleotide-binding domain-containing protein [Lachnospiraceae bacterium]